MKLSMMSLSLLLLALRPAHAGYTSLVVLGDSLSDSGNGALITGNLIPGTPTGRATNGRVAAEYLAQGLGIAGFAPSAAGGTNHAVVGAMTDSRNFNFLVNSPTGVGGIAALGNTGLQTQLQAVAGGAPFDAASTLFMVWGGPNDIFLAGALQQDPQAAAAAAVSNLVGVVQGLLGIGARNILVMGMPNLGLTPEVLAAGASAGFAALSAGFNQGLAAAVTQLDALPGANLMFLDTIAALLPLSEQPEAFGLTNVTDACIDSPQALAAGCAGYAFADGVHPTTFVHHFLAGRMLALVPAPSTLWLAAAAVLAFILRRQGPRARA